MAFQLPRPHNDPDEIRDNLKEMHYRLLRADRAATDTGWHPVFVSGKDGEPSRGVAEYRMMAFIECCGYRILVISFEGWNAFFNVYDSIECAIDESSDFKDAVDMVNAAKEFRLDGICSDSKDEDEDEREGMEYDDI